jgi:hypothetical protein
MWEGLRISMDGMDEAMEGEMAAAQKPEGEGGEMED